MYFSFKGINDLSVESCYHIDENDFRKNYGDYFSEKYLLNTIMQDVYGSKYKHLNSKTLTGDGQPDYYMRNGKKVLLIENKDNLVSKEIMDRCNVYEFTAKIKECLFESYNIRKKKMRPKGALQLINNIENILCKDWDKDPGLSLKNCVFYPVIIINHSEFTLSGVNRIVNEWFLKEITERNINTKHIKNLTIIHIDTFIIYQKLISTNGNNIYDLIDEYWAFITNKSNKKYHRTVEVAEHIYTRYISFDKFVSAKFRNESVISDHFNKYTEILNV